MLTLILQNVSNLSSHPISPMCTNFSHFSKTFILTVLCEDLYLSNGQVSFDQAEVNGQYPVDTVATFTCIHGYSLEGSSTRTCQASGIWNQQVASCRLSNDIREHSYSSHNISNFIVQSSFEISFFVFFPFVSTI